MQSMAAVAGLTYRILTDGDCDNVIKFVQDHFLPHEPLSLAACVKAEEEKAFPNVLIKNVLWQGVSIGVFDNVTDELCAVRINSLGKNEGSLPLEERADMHSLKQQMVHRLLKTLKGDSLRDIVSTNEYMEHVFVIVKQAYAKRGIATELYKQSEAVAKQTGCKKMIAICSSYFTKRSTEKGGYQKVSEIMYEDYVDPVTGEKAFVSIKSPHESVSLMVKTLAV